MAVLAPSRRLPGIDVGVAPPPAVEALPRMDVAVFVGFASTGPVHTPVVVESVAQFAAVFGADAPLAWDQARGRRVSAYLGPAVRAFFANGGRRCWIVRAAGAPVANEFAIPGVLAIADSGVVEAAAATARSEGSWSDGLRVSTAVQSRSFHVQDMAATVSPPLTGSVAVRVRTQFRLDAGDLFEVDGRDGLCVYATADAVNTVPDVDGFYDVDATVHAAFERVRSQSPADLAGLAEVPGLAGPVAATLRAPEDPAAPRPFDPPLPATLTFAAPVPTRLERGHWVRWTNGGQPVWLRIDDVESRTLVVASPPDGPPSMTATVSGAAWREVDLQQVTLEGLMRARTLALDLRVETGGTEVARLRGVGLTRSHESAWWNQVTDAAFYRAGDETARDTDALSARRTRPAFPLAAHGAAVRAWIPLGATSQFGASLAPVSDLSRTALERDGLAPFGAHLFLDPDLADTPLDAVAALADGIRFVREPARPLRGLHAAWSLGAGGLFNEATLLAIPDAVHPGWRARPDEPVPAPEARNPQDPPHWHTHRGPCAVAVDAHTDAPDFGVFLDCDTRVLRAPLLEPAPSPVPPGVHRLTWTDSEPSAGYVLVEYTRADLSDPREIFRGHETEFLVLASREGVFYYQVFAHVGDDRSAGSNVVAIRVRADGWVLDRGDDVAIERTLLAIHRAALRMAAANGDLFVALALPRHFRTEQAIRYARRLREVRQPPAPADRDALGFTEGRALSYGALYFPWLQSDVREPGSRHDSTVEPPTVVPPDGVASGVLAGRASARGAWIAPANEPLHDVVAVSPPVPAADWQALLDAHINVLRDDPRGFLVLSADTLSLDPALRPINVRRLLILLRRLALRRGVSYVFEPNGPALRRAVQRGFDIVLTDLFRRGAFAGALPEQSFRVVADGTINTPADADAGRILVELRVAPSIPMRFIAVRLAQSGARLTVREEL